jgi:uncharacterized protein (DUF4415 family)
MMKSMTKYELSVSAEQILKKGGIMRKTLTPDQIKHLESLEGKPVETGDIPEAPAENWKTAVPTRLFKPLKNAISIRLDADVLEWFKNRAADGGYQTEINYVLRKHMETSG